MGNSVEGFPAFFINPSWMACMGRAPNAKAAWLPASAVLVQICIIHRVRVPMPVLSLVSQVPASWQVRRQSIIISTGRSESSPKGAWAVDKTLSSPHRQPHTCEKRKEGVFLGASVCRPSSPITTSTNIFSAHLHPLAVRNPRDPPKRTRKESVERGPTPTQR